MKLATMTAAVASLALALAGCGGDEATNGTAGTGGENGAGSQTVQLETQEDSGISGEAELTGEGEQTTVEVTADGVEDGKAYPIHVHPGTCDELDPQPEYPLDDVTEGSSETTIDVPLEELTSGEFAINLHDADDPSIYVACGNIEE